MLKRIFSEGYANIYVYMRGVTHSKRGRSQWRFESHLIFTVAGCSDLKCKEERKHIISIRHTSNIWYIVLDWCTCCQGTFYVTPAALCPHSGPVSAMIHCQHWWRRKRIIISFTTMANSPSVLTFISHSFLHYLQYHPSICEIGISMVLKDDR